MIVDELIAILGYDLRGEGDLRKFNQGIKNTERSLATFAAAAARYAAIAATALGAGITYLGKSVISTSAQFESFQATLEVLEGSSAKAKASLDWIKDFGKTTPYEVAEVTEAFVRLRSYGIDPMDGTLRSVGDASSAMGKTLMQGVEALADAATGEFERLKEFGVRASVAGDQVTFSWQENGKMITKTVKKNGAEITQFLTGNFNRFRGAMDKQSKTWRGVVSNLSDTWTQFLLTIGEAGVFDFAKTQLKGLMDWIAARTADGSIARWAKAISDAFIGAANAIGFLVSRIMADGETIFKFISKLDPAVFYALAGAFGLLMIYLFPVTWALGAIVLALDDIAAWMQGGESRFGDLIAWIQEMTGASKELATALAAIAASLLLISGIKVFSVLKGIGNLFAGIAGGASGELAAGGAAARSGGLLALLGKLSPFIAALLLPGSVPNDRKNADPFAEDWQVDELTRFKGYDRSGGPSTRGRYRRAPDRPSGPSLIDKNLMTPEQVNSDASGSISSMLAAMNGNLAKMTAGAAAGATITDARQDNRQFPVNVNASTVVNVQQAVQAPAVAGAAVTSAVGQAAVAGASRIEQGPAQP